MKKIFLALSLMMTVAATTAFAGSSNTENPKAESIFNKQFAGAENVQWSKINEGILKVSFTWSGARAEAFFDENSDLIGTERNIFFNQVPLNVMRSLKARFKDAVVLAVSEVSTTGGTSYHISLEDGNKKYKTIVSSQGDISDVTKVKK